MMNTCKFITTKEERTIIDKIVIRAIELKILIPKNILNFKMDLVVTHSNGNPLDFEKLLSFEKFDFLHDVIGITKHLNRDNGRLQEFFFPRCSRRDN